MFTTKITNGTIGAALLASVTILSSFRGGDNKTYLHKVVSSAGQTTLEYNTDKTISRIVQLHKTEDNSTYNTVQMPVYENGKLVKSLLADDEKATSGDVYQAFEYSGDHISKMSYYRDGQVNTVDSLAYDANGQLATRYQFGRNAKGALVMTGYQQYNWDKEGNVERVDNYGKQPGYSKFVYTSSVSYTYDNKLNPQQERPELAFLLDASAGSISAHNVITESFSSPNSAQVITNTYSYAYNASKFPVKGTFISGLDGSTSKLEWSKLQ